MNDEGSCKKEGKRRGGASAWRSSHEAKCVLSDSVRWQGSFFCPGSEIKRQGKGGTKARKREKRQEARGKSTGMKKEKEGAKVQEEVRGRWCTVFVFVEVVQEGKEKKTCDLERNDEKAQSVESVMARRSRIERMRCERCVMRRKEDE